MILNYFKALAIPISVTVIATTVFAQNTKLAVSQYGTVKSTRQTLPLELKNLPLILDSKIIQFDKLKSATVEKYNLDKVHGPGSGGGGNICAASLLSATQFIISNINEISFQNEVQKNGFLNKMKSAKFLAGSNLEVRGQQVNAINYPSLDIIVIDSIVCASLVEENVTGYRLLLHEYLGIAGIDDTQHQISNPFSEKMKSIIDSRPNLRQLQEKVVATFLMAANNPRSQVGQLIKKHNEDTMDGRNPVGEIELPVRREHLQVVLLGSEEITASWHYGHLEKGICKDEVESATYNIYLTSQTHVHAATGFRVMEFMVEAKSTLYSRVLKMEKGLSCNWLAPSEDDSDTRTTFGPITKRIQVGEIKSINRLKDIK